MKPLLLLVHRLPFPPNKGDKIRSYHLLAHLAARYRVYLGTFIDDPDDWRHVDTVKKLCADVHVANLQPRFAKVRSLGGFLAQRPLTVDYYRDAGMADWVRDVAKAHPGIDIVVFSSAMAQYAEALSDSRRIIDVVDVDSDKWTQYADKKAWPLSWVYRREGKLLLRYERKIAQDFDASLFVSRAEADLFRQRAPESAAKIGYFSNGVDTEYFSPACEYRSPYPSDELPIVFTGAMDYWPNIDAVQWFAEKMMPAVLSRHPRAVFYIVGSRPTEQVNSLARLPGVKVTGTVPDVRPYLAHARVSVAPLRIARGIQNKVLEAMAMAKPVVVSPAALEGIDAKPGRELLLAADEHQFVDAVSALLSAALESLGHAARAKVVSQYGWAANLGRIDELLKAVPAAASHGISGRMGRALKGTRA